MTLVVSDQCSSNNLVWKKTISKAKKSCSTPTFTFFRQITALHFYLNFFKNQNQIDNMSFAFKILANNIKIALQYLNKSKKKTHKTNEKKTAISHLSFLTCYRKQTWSRIIILKCGRTCMVVRLYSIDFHSFVEYSIDYFTIIV